MDSSSPRPSKQAACLVCRRGKIKCDYIPQQNRCRRCIQLDAECVRPDFHAGRQRGIKNKRVGIDKAFYQVQQAIKRARSTANPSDEDARALARLREIISEAEGATASQISPSQSSRQGGAEEEDDDGDGGGGSGSESEDADGTGSAATPAAFAQQRDENLDVDGAENPLQLLARASYFRPSTETRTQPSPQQPKPEGRSNISAFFTSPRSDLDVGDDVDPISLGLVSEEEAESLFTFFHTTLAHTRWGMDPRMYNVEFTRSRSAFLTTSIMAASALFLPQHGALSKRLSNHVKTLAQRVIVRRHRSVEIVLAFVVNIPWMFPGQRTTDDETCAYVSMATTVAIDLLMHKTLVSKEALEQGVGLTLARGECLDTRTALDIDGYPDVEPWSDRGAMLLRSRERCWISLWVVERGMCLARGRPFIVPNTRLIKDCDGWHRSNHAHPHDGHVVSMAVLRRDLDALFSNVRALCDGSQAVSSDGSMVAQTIQSSIEQFFDRWHTQWGPSIGSGPDRRLPPYVEILVTHTRLSIYGGVINHPTAPIQVKRFFRTAGLSSALNVMRVAIQGEAQLQSMPNNTAIMISFAACFALTLSAYATDGSALAPSVRKLIDEAAGVLERIGSVTKHRNGLSVLYGSYLRRIVKKAASASRRHGHHHGHTQAVHHAQRASHAASSSISPASVAARTPASVGASMQYAAAQHPATTPSMDPSQQNHTHQGQGQQLMWPETLPFSTMSDDQIVQVLNQPGNEFAPSFGGLSWEDMNNFDWLHWPEFGT